MAQTVKNTLSSPERVIESSCILMRSTLPFISRFSHPCIFQMQAWLSMQEIPVCSFIPQSYQHEAGLPLAHQIWTRPELVHIRLGLELPLCPALPGSNLHCSYFREFTALLSRGSDHESLNPSVVQSTEGMLNQDLVSVSTVLLSSQLR